MNRTRRLSVSLAAVTLVLCFHAATALAHPGHGDGVGQGSVAGEIRHHVTEPVHAFPIAASVLVSGLMVLWGVHRIGRSNAAAGDARS